MPSEKSKDPPEGDIRQADNDLLRFHGDAAAAAVDDAAANYQSPSIIAAGADARGVSILTTVTNLALALVCLKAPALIEKAGLARRGALILAFLNLLAWVPLAMAFFLSWMGIAPGWFALLWFINLVPGMLLSVQRDNWLSNIVPGGSLGRYLGQRLAIKSAFYLGAFCLLGYLLDRLGRANVAGFTVVFTVAIAVALVDFIIFTFMSSGKGERIKMTAETQQFGITEYFGELRAKKLDTFVIFTTFFYLTVGLSGPLYAVYMLSDLHFSYFSYTIIISAEFLARVVSSPFWGRFADKAGNIRVLGIVSRIIPVVPVAWLFWHSLGYLILVQILSGTCWGAFDLCTQSYLYKVAPQPKKLRYIVYTRCLVLLCTATGGLLGAICLNGIFPTFGSRILSIFWLSGIARGLVVMYMMPRLVDMAISFAPPHRPPDIDLNTLNRVLAARRGGFYHRGRLAEASVAHIESLKKAAIADMQHHAAHWKWVQAAAAEMPGKAPVLETRVHQKRLIRYREAMAARSREEPAPPADGTAPGTAVLKKRLGLEKAEMPMANNVARHDLKENEAKLRKRFRPRRQLGAATMVTGEMTVAHHEIGEKLGRLRERDGVAPALRAAAARAEDQKAVLHHEIRQNLERLKLRYHPERPPAPVAARTLKLPAVTNIVADAALAPVTRHTGLYRNKVGWANYLKQSFDQILLERRRREPVGAIAQPVFTDRHAYEGI